MQSKKLLCLTAKSEGAAEAAPNSLTPRPYPLLLRVNRHAKHRVGGIQHCLRQRGMCVNDVGQLFGGAFHLQSQNRFCDHFGRIRPNNVYAQNLAVLDIADDLDEALVRADDRSARVRGEGELADLQFVARFLSLGFGQAYAADLRMAIRGARYAQLVDLLRRFAGDMRHRNNAFHRAGVRQLWIASHDIADGVDAGLGRAHVAVNFDKAALNFDLRLLDAHVLRARRSADGDQYLFRFDFVLFAVGGEGNRNAGLRLFDLLDLGVDEAVDPALPVDAHQLFGNLFVFDRHVARQHLEDGDLRAKRLVDAGELHAHGAGADHDQRFGNLLEAEDFDVGENLLVRRHPRQHARNRPGRQDDLFHLEGLLLAAFDGNSVNAAARRAGQLAVAADDVDLVLAHQELQSLGMLVDDPLLALLNDVPVQADAGGILQSELGAFLYVVKDLGVEEQSLGRDAADVQAGPAQDGVFLDESCLQSQLSGANGRGISGRSAADDGYVINRLNQVRAPVC